MNRREIKTKAKELLKGHVNELFTPALIIILIQLFLNAITDYYAMNSNNEQQWAAIFTFVQSIILAPLSVGYIAYVMNFVRKRAYNLGQVFSFYSMWVTIAGVSILVTLAVMAGAILLIIPGIIFALMFAMVNYIIVDGEDDIMTILAKSRELMNGYKWDYFVFGLSYLGWIILSFFTFGLLFIWVIPYMMLGQVLYYENLVNKNKKSSKK